MLNKFQALSDEANDYGKRPDENMEVIITDLIKPTSNNSNNNKLLKRVVKDLEVKPSTSMVDMAKTGIRGQDRDLLKRTIGGLKIINPIKSEEDKVGNICPVTIVELKPGPKWETIAAIVILAQQPQCSVQRRQRHLN